MTVNGHGMARSVLPARKVLEKGKKPSPASKFTVCHKLCHKEVKSEEDSWPASPPVEEQGPGQTDEPLLPNAAADPELEPEETPTRRAPWVITSFRIE